MKANKILSGLLSLGLSLSMGLGQATAVFAEVGGKKLETETEISKPSGERKDIQGTRKAEGAVFQKYADTDVVRVSIVLEGKATTGRYATKGIAGNSQAMKYRDVLQKEQKSVTERIEQNVLGGRKLDVVWNLTLAANLISANVEYGKIEGIKAQSGVKTVVIEKRYEPAVAEKNDNDPNMATSGEMIGRSEAYAAGYTGAGSRIAIIDTGIDTDHQSFDADAFEYSLKQNAELAGVSYDEYVKGLDLLTAADIKAVSKELNVFQYRDTYDEEENEISVKYKGLADDLYLTSKIPFAFNYADNDLDITHDNDKEGEHGSHVSGIAAANAYIPDGEGYANALEKVYTQGVAPDAQIISMKVFGKKGGAYQSDYMAAIEDAIILGADSINLSLGSTSPGFTSDSDSIYEDLLNSLEKTDSVVSISMGNAYSFPQYSYVGVNYGLTYNYYEDPSMSTGGSPGSYTNAFTVASADNTGKTDQYMNAYGYNIFFNESLIDENEEPYGNEAMQTIAGDHEFVYLDAPGAVNEDPNDDASPIINQFDEVADLVKGKIAICNRGTSSFFQKANAAAESGAAAVIITNNQPGTIFMNLTGYEYTIPAVTISKNDGDLLKHFAEKHETESGLTYYTGKLTVGKGVAVEHGYGPVAMSDFSSWGVPESLELKPEISAPGGNIYSVNGLEEGGKAYENMSGTSMAAPQIAGMAALVSQYIQENGLAEQEGMTVRALTQSLLMGTAVPQVEYVTGDDGNPVPSGYYSVLKQGAGLADVGAAVSAKSYITMDSAATRAAADGKVKVELGDDPARKGVYTYTFTVNNMTDDETSYELGSVFFTQDVTAQGYVWMMPQTWLLNTSEVYTVDGKETDTITVPAHGKVKVTATVTISDTDDAEEYYYGKETLDQYVSGAYVEGYTYLIPAENTAEGVIDDVMQTIPVLGFYGNWSDGDMFDKEDYLTDAFGTAQYYPYTYDSYIQSAIAAALEEDPEKTDFSDVIPEYRANIPIINGDIDMINPIGLEEEAFYERRSINNAASIGYLYRLIRNAAAVAMYAKDSDGNIIWVSEPQTDVSRPFYYAQYGTWLEYGEDGLYYYGATPLEFEDKLAGSFGVEDGDTLTLGVVAVPEYYSIDKELTSTQIRNLLTSGVLGKGAVRETEYVVDNEYPEVLNTEIIEEEDGSYTLKVTAKDNRYIAGLMFMDTALAEDIDSLEELENPEDLEKLIGFMGYAQGPAEQTEGGEVVLTLTIPQNKYKEGMTGVVFDYAGNLTEIFDYVSDEALVLDPAETEAVAGTEVTFTAKNEKDMEIHPKNLEWTVDGATSADTAIEKGVLTIGEDEKAETLTVTAVLDPSASFYPVAPGTGPDAGIEEEGDTEEPEEGEEPEPLSATATVKVIPLYNVTVTAEGKGTVDPEEAKIARGETVTITITPDEGYFAVVKVNGEEADASEGKIEITVDADKEVTVTFKELINAITMYRLYNPNSGEHFFTGDMKEKDTLVEYGWTFEGIGWYAPEKSATPVYRLYNAEGGEHHYTVNPVEREALINLGWTDENIGWYSDDENTVALYRLYNPNEFANNHHYTTDTKEKDTLIGYGWRDEGIGWYGVTPRE